MSLGVLVALPRRPGGVGSRERRAPTHKPFRLLSLHSRPASHNCSVWEFMAEPEPPCTVERVEREAQTRLPAGDRQQAAPVTTYIRQQGEGTMSTTNHDIDSLIDADELAHILKKPVKSVYELPIPKVKLGPRTVRWKPEDVQKFIDDRYDEAA